MPPTRSTSTHATRGRPQTTYQDGDVIVPSPKDRLSKHPADWNSSHIEPRCRDKGSPGQMACGFNPFVQSNPNPIKGA